MIAIITAYLSLQLASTLFLFFQLPQKTELVTHLVLASLAVLSYLAAHFRTPGYANSEKLKLAPSVSLDLSGTVLPTSNKMAAGEAVGAERGFCRYCKDDQLVRMKHCHDCQRCVATFDHHCLWLDNCIGEKNRPVFYLCLWANLAEIAHAVIVMVVEMYRAGEWFPYQIAFLSFAGVVGTGVALLAFLHTYLMATNITTWESIRWKTIHYLIDLDRKQGSPFDRGIRGNIADYWKAGFQSSYREWKFNANAVEQLNNKTMAGPKETTT